MFCAIAMPETRARVGNSVIALVDDSPHEDREKKSERNALDADRVEIGEGKQSRAQRANDDGRPPADPIRQTAHDGNSEHCQYVAEDGNPQIDVRVETDPVRRLYGICSTKDCGDDGDHVGERDAEDANDIIPAEPEGF